MSAVREEVVTHLRNFLTARHSLASDVPLDDSTGLLGRGLGLDSVEALQLVSRMEEALGLTIGDEELDAAHFQTVGAFVRFIEEHVR